MSTDHQIDDLLVRFAESSQADDFVPTRPVASAQGRGVEESAAMRGTAREVVDAKPRDLAIRKATRATTGGESGGNSEE